MVPSDSCSELKLVEICERVGIVLSCTRRELAEVVTGSKFDFRGLNPAAPAAKVAGAVCMFPPPVNVTGADEESEEDVGWEPDSTATRDERRLRLERSSPLPVVRT